MVDATLAGQLQVPPQPVDVDGEVAVLQAVEQVRSRVDLGKGREMTASQLGAE